MDVNQQHHFFYDAWIKQNYVTDEFKNGRTAFPCIELSILDHKKAHRSALDFFENLDGWNVRRTPSLAEWKTIDSATIEALAKHMAESISIDSKKINKLKNLSQGFLVKCHKLKGC